MENILYRIEKIAQNEGMTISKMETTIGASKGVLSKALSKDSDIQSKWIQIIMEKFPQYNAEWLLTGKGDMLKNSPPDDKVKIYEETNEGTHSVLEEQSEYISQNKRYIDSLLEIIKSKDEIIKSKDETINIQKETIESLKMNLELKDEWITAFRSGDIIIVNKKTDNREE